jgi:hypothetical protein
LDRLETLHSTPTIIPLRSFTRAARLREDVTLDHRPMPARFSPMPDFYLNRKPLKRVNMNATGNRPHVVGSDLTEIPSSV